MYLIHIIIDRLIPRLRTVIDEYIPLKLSGVMLAGKTFQLFDQFLRLLPADKLRSLHRIHKKLQLRKFKLPAANIISAVGPLRLQNVYSKLPQCLDVAIHRLTVGRHPILPQYFVDVCRRHRILLIRLLQKHLHNIQCP